MTDSIIIMAAGASSRMKKPIVNNNLTKDKIKSANSKSKVLIEFGSEPKPFLSYSILKIIEAGFKNIYIVSSEDAGYFRNNFKDVLKIGLSNCSVNFSIQYLPINSIKPLGTADAIYQTMEQFPVLKHQSFCVCNGDNLYSVKSLKEIKSNESNNAFIAYDRNGLNFSVNRISSFAVVKMNEENFLIDVIEKPDAETIDKSLDILGKIRVSMNLFKFHGSKCFSYFKNCPLNKKRMEKEITDVLKSLIKDGEINILGIPMNENVLDLTSKNDIVQVNKYFT